MTAVQRCLESSWGPPSAGLRCPSQHATLTPPLLMPTGSSVKGTSGTGGLTALACGHACSQETVYGLAGNALSAAAVTSIYSAKGRPADNPLIVHISSLVGRDPVFSRFGCCTTHPSCLLHVESACNPTCGDHSMCACMHDLTANSDALQACLLVTQDADTAPSHVKCGKSNSGIIQSWHHQIVAPSENGIIK